MKMIKSNKDWKRFASICRKRKRLKRPKWLIVIWVVRSLMFNRMTICMWILLMKSWKNIICNRKCWNKITIRLWSICRNRYIIWKIGSHVSNIWMKRYMIWSSNRWKWDVSSLQLLFLIFRSTCIHRYMFCSRNMIIWSTNWIGCHCL